MGLWWVTWKTNWLNRWGWRAQELEQVSVDPRLLDSACYSILGQDSEPPAAPDVFND